MRGSPIRTAGWLVVAGLLGAALVAPAATFATKPSPDHKVTICHATNSNTNPYVVESVDIASSGYVKGGHSSHAGPIWDATLKAKHISWGDIIPSYRYGVFSYAGLNWTAEGRAIRDAGCTIPQPSQPDSPSSSIVPSGSVEAETGSLQPSGSVEAETGSLQPSGSVEGETGAASPTLPATDAAEAAATASADGWRILLLVMAVVLGASLALTPAGSRRR